MRKYINIVEDAVIIQFPGARQGNVEQSDTNQINVFSADSRFALVITSGTILPNGIVERGMVLKVEDLTMEGLMHYLKTYNVKSVEPDVQRFWKSAPKLTEMGKVIYDLHVFKSDHTSLSLEQFNAVNRMIRNDFTVPLTWRKR